MSGTSPIDSTASLASRVRQLQLKSLPPAQGTSGKWGWVVSVILAGVLTYTLLKAPPSSKGGKASALPQAQNSAQGTSSSPSREASPSNPGALPEKVPVPGQVLLEAKGYVIPEREILVSPLVSGRVVELNFQEGMRVTRGDVLAIIEKTDYQAEFNRAEANVAAAHERLAELLEGNRPDEIRRANAELAETEANLDQARRTYERNVGLLQRQIINDQQLEESQAQFESLQQRAEALRASQKLMIEGPRKERKRASEAELRQFEADLAKAKWRLDNCTISAPISGTILKKNAEQGNIVNPIAFNGSFSLCNLADLSRLEVDLSIQERDISKVFPGQRCKVRVDAYMNRNYDGFVSRLMPIADRAKGALPVRVRVIVPADEEGVYLKPEMSALVTFYAEKAEPEKIAVKPDEITDQPKNQSAN